MALVGQVNETIFLPVKKVPEEWVDKYAQFFGMSWDKCACQKWAQYHYNVFLGDGVLPNFMK